MGERGGALFIVLAGIIFTCVTPNFDSFMIEDYLRIFGFNYHALTFTDFNHNHISLNPLLPMRNLLGRFWWNSQEMLLLGSVYIISNIINIFIILQYKNKKLISIGEEYYCFLNYCQIWSFSLLNYIIIEKMFFQKSQLFLGLLQLCHLGH